MLDRKPGLTLEAGAQRLAFHEGHDEIRYPPGGVFHRARVEYREDMWMLESSGELDFLEEAVDRRRSAGPRPDDFQRHRPVVAEILREKDCRHPAGADLALDDVAISQLLGETVEGFRHR